MNKQYYVYLISNSTNTVLYTGVTNDLKRRIYQHKERLIEGFTKKYNVDKLVYYGVCESIEGAICREKQLKGWLRSKKSELIARQNPLWHDLYDEI